jgi:hypothetical protein
MLEADVLNAIEGEKRSIIHNPPKGRVAPEISNINNNNFFFPNLIHPLYKS